VLELPDWALWLVLGSVLGFVAGVLLSLSAERVVHLGDFWRARSPAAADRDQPVGSSGRPAGPGETARFTHGGSDDTKARTPESAGPRRLLIVDDDPALRLLLRTTLAADRFAVEEAGSAAEAAELARFWRPAFVILDVGLADADGLVLCRELKRSGQDRVPIVVLLTGADTSDEDARAAGADALLYKPFSPLELVGLLDRLAGSSEHLATQAQEPAADQLLQYARDLSRLLEIERAQRRLLQQAYRQTTSALADALEAKDRRTGLHALRVQAYALELAAAVDASLLDDPSLEHGFLLHDIGKIAIPDSILNKPGPLTHEERRLVHQHPLLGAEILKDVALLQGEGLHVVRSHHERWDGGGYPDRLAEQQIPLGARIFALADTLDAMTTDRPYRDALGWQHAVEEILVQDGRQFDPQVVTAFTQREQLLHRLHTELTASIA
jgi:response regulator RpfG family c-di-GMP phosphodiesterase